MDADKTAETSETTQKTDATEATPEVTNAKSVVDTFFDSLTKKTADALLATQTALERVARFLEARAKVAGELAVKLR